MPTTNQKYDVILADPPWSFRVWNKDTGNGRSAESHYRTMSLADICNLPIKELTSPNCVLFLWSVWPSIFDAKEVIDSWGFKYKSLGFEWWKLNKNWLKTINKLVSNNYPYREFTTSLLQNLFFFGMGYYTRTNSEPCLLATKGSMPVAVHNERNFIISPRREHSRKPDEQYEKIERLYPNTRKLELFARYKHDGWDVWGNEVKNDVQLEGFTK